MFVLSGTFFQADLFPYDVAFIAAIPVCWVLWAFVACGGLSLPLAGITLVRKDGRRASRLACGWRTLLVWALPTVLLIASRYVRETDPAATGLASGLWLATVLVLLGFLALALVLRSRGPHDRLAGTQLVPL